MKAIFFFVVLPIFIMLVILLGVMRTQFIEASGSQTQFVRGSTTTLPDGSYNGKINFFSFGWKGKKFNKATGRGINVFGTTQSEKYPFIFYTGKGLRDSNTTVIKIDYNIKGNPFYMRWILDEITEYAPGKYIGKVHLRLLPYLPITLAYFYLEK